MPKAAGCSRSDPLCMPTLFPSVVPLHNAH